MGRISVGTCSWTDSALVSSGWYPAECRDAEHRLRYYARQFPVVEVDATYYALPSTRNSLLWVDRTPDGFTFDVKAFSLLTGHPTRPGSLPAELRSLLPPRVRPGAVDDRLSDEVWQRFSGALLPLREAGRLGTLLFQFPPSLAPGVAATRFLRDCVERAQGWPLAVEFRHPLWWQDEHRAATTALLERLGVAAVAVDTAQSLPTSIPRLPWPPRPNWRWFVSTAATGPGEAARRKNGSATPIRARNWPSGCPECACWPKPSTGYTCCSTIVVPTQPPGQPKQCAACSTGRDPDRVVERRRVRPARPIDRPTTDGNDMVITEARREGGRQPCASILHTPTVSRRPTLPPVRAHIPAGHGVSGDTRSMFDPIPVLCRWAKRGSPPDARRGR